MFCLAIVMIIYWGEFSKSVTSVFLLDGFRLLHVNAECLGDFLVGRGVPVPFLIFGNEAEFFNEKGHPPRGLMHHAREEVELPRKFLQFVMRTL